MDNGPQLREGEAAEPGDGGVTEPRDGKIAEPSDGPGDGGVTEPCDGEIAESSDGGAARGRPSVRDEGELSAEARLPLPAGDTAAAEGQAEPSARGKTADELRGETAKPKGEVAAEPRGQASAEPRDKAVEAAKPFAISCKCQHGLWPASVALEPEGLWFPRPPLLKGGGRERRLRNAGDWIERRAPDAELK